MIYVLAGNHAEAADWAARMLLHNREWTPVEPERIRGRMFEPGDRFIGIGTWLRRNDLHKIRLIIGPQGMPWPPEVSSQFPL